jgi:hypothetical protein
LIRVSKVAEFAPSLFSSQLRRHFERFFEEIREND